MSVRLVASTSAARIVLPAVAPREAVRHATGGFAARLGWYNQGKPSPKASIAGRATQRVQVAYGKNPTYLHRLQPAPGGWTKVSRFSLLVYKVLSDGRATEKENWTRLWLASRERSPWQEQRGLHRSSRLHWWLSTYSQQHDSTAHYHPERVRAALASPCFHVDCARTGWD